MNNSDGLQESRLATTDENGNRVYVHPEDISGKWKDRRAKVYWFLIFIYLVLPWIYIDGKQWLLLDLPKREFHIFGQIFYGHDGPLLFFLLLGFVIFMAYITSLLGRVWCGWACPQTVFIDTIFRKIEKLVEGKARARRELDRAPMSFNKLVKRVIKWFLFILVSLHIVHSFLGYFVGTHKLFWITLSSPAEHWSLFLTMLVMTFIILFDFGWFREQFCIIACPYGRFQSVVMDDNSLNITYDYNRGEPRREKGVDKSAEGDCINCNHCVKACPTGIDIREGTQLECISCTMCIDACDNIMRKVKKPEGLIRYTTQNEIEGRPKDKYHIRSAIYLLILLILGIGLFFSLSLRKEMKFHAWRGNKSVAYQQITTDSGEVNILNQFRIKLYQTGGHTEDMYLEIDPKFGEQIKLTTPFENIIEMKEDSFEAPIFLQYKDSVLINGSRTIKLSLVNLATKSIVKTIEVKLVGPIR